MFSPYIVVVLTAGGYNYLHSWIVCASTDTVILAEFGTTTTSILSRLAATLYLQAMT